VYNWEVSLEKRLHLQGPGDGDGSAAEKVVNVVTSLPFVAVGIRALKSRCV